MKKILAVLMVISILFAFAGCSSKEYTETAVTIPVTDENGETVTDNSGNVVMEVVTEAAESEKKEDKETTSNTSKDSKTTTKKSSSDTTAKSKESTTKKNSKNESTSKKSTEKTTTTTTKKDETTESTTEKAKKRDVTVYVKLPYYNDKETKLYVNYKEVGDKEYKRLEFDDPDKKGEKIDCTTIKLDGRKEPLKFDLGKLTGDVKVIIRMSDVDISGETIIIPADESSGTLAPYTGIEMMQGEDM